MSVKPRNIRRIRYQDNDDDVIDDLQDTKSSGEITTENETRSPALISLASMDENSTSTSNDTTPTKKMISMISPIVVLIGIMLGVATFYICRCRVNTTIQVTLLRLPILVLRLLG